MKLFDDVAEKFAGAVDRALELDNYPRGRLFLELARRVAPANGLLLDYGCGPGRLSQLLARSGFRVRAVDVSEGMLAQARKLDCTNLDIEFRAIATVADVLLGSAFDAIVCSSVIEYVQDPDELLSGFRAALRNGGGLVISYANKSSLWRRHAHRTDRAENPMYTEHNHTWQWHEFRRLLERNGFRREGYARGFLKINGAWRDHVLFGLIESDARPIKRPCGAAVAFAWARISQLGLLSCSHVNAPDGAPARIGSAR